ncbi:hypothetical protein T484DRAFT_1797127 [Baffinella frigidus]|nr:hypothetical protein T484DRAFT_1797127 [Cryptophyta sp. CCMP2293]
MTDTDYAPPPRQLAADGPGPLDRSTATPSADAAGPPRYPRLVTSRPAAEEKWEHGMWLEGRLLAVDLRDVDAERER